jgi:hypothetical protein
MMVAKRVPIEDNRLPHLHDRRKSPRDQECVLIEGTEGPQSSHRFDEHARQLTVLTAHAIYQQRHATMGDTIVPCRGERTAVVRHDH